MNQTSFLTGIQMVGISNGHFMAIMRNKMAAKNGHVLGCPV
jgi:hypothetical protein